MKKRQWYKYEKKTKHTSYWMWSLPVITSNEADSSWAICTWHHMQNHNRMKNHTFTDPNFLYVNKPIRWLSDYQNSCQSWPRLTNKWLRKTVTHWRKRNKPGTLTGWTGGPFESPASGSFCPDTLQTCLRVLSLSLSQHLKLYQNQKVQ